MISQQAEVLLQKVDPKTYEELPIIIEASRKASSVASNLQLFVQLAKEPPPLARIVAVRPSEVFPRIDRAVKYLYSHRALDKNLRFVLEDGWRKQMRSFLADVDRLDLIFDNLLDNAVKYSYADTTVRITGGALPNDKDVWFSFQNQGLPISADDVDRLAYRGHRGDKARMSHPEGTGIGLWMVAQLLKSMHGRLDIFPTSSRGVNEVRVYLRRT